MSTVASGFSLPRCGVLAKPFSATILAHKPTALISHKVFRNISHTGQAKIYFCHASARAVVQKDTQLYFKVAATATGIITALALSQDLSDDDRLLESPKLTDY